MTDITLKSSGINGGVAVNLQGASLVYRWSNYTNTPDTPSKFAATDAQVTVDFNGWTNPVIIIRGVIDSNNISTNSITLELLKLFSQEKTNDVYIVDSVLFPDADTTKVQVKSFRINRSYSDDVNEGRLDYNIELVETL